MTAPRTVLMLLRLNESACTTRIGCRYPGSDPRGSRRLAHQISPRRTSPLIRRDAQGLHPTELGIEFRGVRVLSVDTVQRLGH